MHLTCSSLSRGFYSKSDCVSGSIIYSGGVRGGGVKRKAIKEAERQTGSQVRTWDLSARKGQPALLNVSPTI